MDVRGLLPSLGAGGSLIAAALCAAALVSGILAFRGEPQGVGPADAGDVRMPAATAAGRPATATAAVTAQVPVLTAGQAGALPRRADPADRVDRRSTRGPAPRGDERRPDAIGEPAPQPSQPPGRTPAPPADGAPAPPSGEPPAPAGGPLSVRRAVERTREAVAPVVEAAPAPAKPPVNAVGDLVEDVAGTVDETLAPVVGLLP